MQQISKLCVTFFLPSLLFSEIGPLATPKNRASCKRRAIRKAEYLTELRHRLDHHRCIAHVPTLVIRIRFRRMETLQDATMDSVSCQWYSVQRDSWSPWQAVYGVQQRKSPARSASSVKADTLSICLNTGDIPSFAPTGVSRQYWNTQAAHAGRGIDRRGIESGKGEWHSTEHRT